MVWGADFISHKLFLQSFCKRTFPHKCVNLFCVWIIVKDTMRICGQVEFCKTTFKTLCVRYDCTSASGRVSTAVRKSRPAARPRLVRARPKVCYGHVLYVCTGHVLYVYQFAIPVVQTMALLAAAQLPARISDYTYIVCRIRISIRPLRISIRPIRISIRHIRTSICHIRISIRESVGADSGAAAGRGSALRVQGYLTDKKLHPPGTLP